MDRWANIEELVVSIEDYQHNNKENTLSDYLEEVSLLTDIDRWNDKNDVLTLMTIHSAKGLEFDFVYLVGLEDGLFPMIRGYDEMDLEEERRLFYVAITRAQKSVFMTYAKTRMRFGGQPNVTIKSRFINEIPGNLLLAEYKKKKFIGDDAIKFMFSISLQYYNYIQYPQYNNTIDFFYHHICV